MRIKFSKDWDYRTPEVTVSYASGSEETVRKEIGEAAIAAGAGREAEVAKTPEDKKTAAPPAKSDG